MHYCEGIIVAKLVNMSLLSQLGFDYFYKIFCKLKCPNIHKMSEI